MENLRLCIVPGGACAKGVHSHRPAVAFRNIVGSLHLSCVPSFLRPCFFALPSLCHFVELMTYGLFDLSENTTMKH